MSRISRYLGLAATLAALTLAAPASFAQVPANAKTACMVAVNKNYGGKVKTLDVVSSEFSQANSEVILNADGQRWRCLVSNDGTVQDLSVQESAKASSSAQPSSNSNQATTAARAACQTAVKKNYGGTVKHLKVISSEYSEANSEVILDAQGQRWRCLASNDGKVQDLSVQ